MQQVVRSIRQKHNRDRLRHKIQQITPQQYSNNIRYYNNPSISPHKILAHQYQHLNRYAYNKNQVIGNRNIYPLSQALIYQPLRRNQLKAEEERSKNLMHGNQFLKGYDPIQYKVRKDDYYKRLSAIERVNRQQEQIRQRQRQIKRNKSVILPPIKPTKPKKSYLSRKLKSISIAVYFACMIRRRFVTFIESRRKFCEQNHKKLMQTVAVQTMKNYYYSKLEKEITLYIILLQKKFKYPTYNIEKDAIFILVAFSQKINNLSIPTSLIQILKIICCNYSFFPHPYLFMQQLKRLQFSEQYECLINMTTDRSCMLTSGLIIIKLLCFNLFFRPWLVQDLFRKKNEKYMNIASNYNDLQKTINRIGSIFYFIAIDNFILTNQVIQRSKRQTQFLLKQSSIETVPFLTIFPSEDKVHADEKDTSSQQDQNEELTHGEISTITEMNRNMDFSDSTNLIVGQNRRFYEKMKNQYKDQMEQIQTNMTSWVTKITLSVLDQNQKQRKQRVQQFLNS